jgi:hypothetical protein
MPVEIAMAKYDEVVRLLVALGAEVNLPTKDSLAHGGDDRDNHFTYLDWAQAIPVKLREVKELTASLQSQRTNVSGATVTSSDSSTPTWKSELLKLAKEVEEAEREANKSSMPSSGPETFIDEIKEYFDSVAELLPSYGGKNGAQIFRSRMDNSQRLQGLIKRIHTYYALNYNHNFGLNMPHTFWRCGCDEGSGMRSELVARYEELYAACWSGNNAKIQRMCVPQKEQQATETPLQIAVQWGDRWRGEYPSVVLHSHS